MPIHEAALWAAYRATRYVAGADAREITIRIDRETPALDDLLEARGVRSWCFVTAANPGSERLDARENAARNEALRARLDADGLGHVEGEGRADAADWPAEPSFLVLGPTRAEARALGAAFDQMAVVYGELGGRAQLLDCRTESPRERREEDSPATDMDGGAGRGARG